MTICCSRGLLALLSVLDTCTVAQYTCSYVMCLTMPWIAKDSCKYASCRADAHGHSPADAGGDVNLSPDKSSRTSSGPSRLHFPSLVPEPLPRSDAKQRGPSGAAVAQNASFFQGGVKAKKEVRKLNPTILRSVAWLQSVPHRLES